MLLRDILSPREDPHYFDKAFIRLRDGKSVYVEKRLKGTPATRIGWYYVCLNKKYVDCSICAWGGDREERFVSSELEAQAVLDHYIVTYGLPEEATCPR